MGAGAWVPNHPSRHKSYEIRHKILFLVELGFYIALIYYDPYISGPIWCKSTGNIVNGIRVESQPTPREEVPLMPLCVHIERIQVVGTVVGARGPQTRLQIGPRYGVQ